MFKHYLGWLDGFGPDGKMLPEYAAEIADTLDRYEIVMRHELQAIGLTDGERGLIAAALTATPPATSMMLSLDTEIEEAMRARRGALVRKWCVDPVSFARKLRALSPAQKCAIIEAFERGWLGTRAPSQLPSA